MRHRLIRCDLLRRRPIRRSVTGVSECTVKVDEDGVGKVRIVLWRRRQGDSETPPLVVGEEVRDFDVVAEDEVSEAGDETTGSGAG
jgi:hypothetical protein